MGKLDNCKANLHMYCLQGNVRPFFKTILDFLSLGKYLNPPPKKKTTKEPKKTKKAKKNRKLVQINESLCLLLCLGKFNTE